MRVLCVAGARPNFMKLASLVRAMGLRGGFEVAVVHTGQHYDQKMSQVFFEQLLLPRPDEDLGVGSGSHATQWARIMERFEPVVRARRPDVVLVVGDVNSTLACALVASREGVPVAHVEAGLRSGDRTMPEEINRVVTDAVADLLLVSEPSGMTNLAREGAPPERCFLVGNTMVDTLLVHLEAARELDSCRRFKLEPRKYGVVTLHRPALVDDPARLAPMVAALGRVARRLPLVFPAHPRTAGRLGNVPAGLRVVEPLGYLEFLSLQADARMLLTDSGGIQEESVPLGVPCLTIRANTERPATIEAGTNRLVGVEPAEVERAALETLDSSWPVVRLPEGWDGRAGDRIAQVLSEHLPRLGRR